MEHLPDDSHRYYIRENANHLIDSFENLFIGNVLLKAADHLADITDLEIHELIDLQKPLRSAVERPDADGMHEYEFIIALADDYAEGQKAHCPFEFILTHSHSSTMPFADLTELQKSHLLKQVLATEGIDEDILELFSPDASFALQNSIACTQQLYTRYNCSQYENTITKTITAIFYIGDTELASLGFDLGVVDETEDAEDTTDLYTNPFLLAEIGSSLGIIQPADMSELNEILYYLNLPGGVIATEVTADYAADDSRIVSEA
jgi:hypothetical protein